MIRHRKANAFPDLGTPGDPRLLAAIERRTPGIAGGGINHFFGSTVITPPKKTKRTASSAVCQFGKVISIDDGTFTKAIRGGLMTCGDKNFAVPDKGFSVAGDGEWLVQIKLSGISANTDDDNEIILPGVKSSSSTPTWDLKAWTTGTDYDANTNWTTVTGTASAVIPLGRLKITDSVPAFTALGCGGISVSQCAGVLNFARA